MILRIKVSGSGVIGEPSMCIFHYDGDDHSVSYIRPDDTHEWHFLADVLDDDLVMVSVNSEHHYFMLGNEGPSVVKNEGESWAITTENPLVLVDSFKERDALDFLGRIRNLAEKYAMQHPNEDINDYIAGLIVGPATWPFVVGRAVLAEHLEQKHEE